MTNNEIEAEFLIADYQCKSSDITNLLSLQPTQTTKKGEFWRYGISPSGEKVAVRHKRNTWSLKSSLPLNSDIEKHINWLLNKIEPQLLNIKILPDRYAKEISVWGYTFDSQSSIYLDKRMMQFMAKSGLGLDIDVQSMVAKNLETTRQVDKLTKKLASLKHTTNATVQNEANNIAEALAVFEEHSDGIPDLIDGLFWDQPTDAQHIESLEEIKRKLNKIIKAIEKSRYFLSK